MRHHFGPYRYLTPQGAFCAKAIEFHIARGIAAQQDFIDRYTGEPRRYWEKAVREQVVARVWQEAGFEQCMLVGSLTPNWDFTAEERKRLAALEWAQPLDVPDLNDPAFKAAMVEKDTIQRRAQRRAYDRTLATINRSAARAAKQAA